MSSPSIYPATRWAVAQQNCRRHRVDDRVALVKADLLTAFAAGRQFPLLVFESALCQPPPDPPGAGPRGGRL